MTYTLYLFINGKIYYYCYNMMYYKNFRFEKKNYIMGTELKYSHRIRTQFLLW